MSKDDGASSALDLSIPGVVAASSGSSTVPETSSGATPPSSSLGYSSASTVVEGDPISAEDMEAIMNEPMGPVPSAQEMEDREDARRNAQRSSDNLLPREKLENGLKHAKMLLATGWAGFTSSVRELEKNETMGKIKSGTVTMIDRSMDGLSKVGSRVAEATDNGMKVVGAKMEEAAPTIGRWRDNVVVAGERGFASAKELTGRAITEIKKAPGSVSGGQGGAWPGNSSASGSGSTLGGAGSGRSNATDQGEAGPHTV